MADFFIQVTLKEERHKKEKESLWLPLFLAFVADSAAPIWYFLLHHLQHPAGWLSQGFFLFSFPPLRSFPTGNWAWTTVGGGEGKSKHGILLQLPFFPPRLICPCHVYRAHSNGFHTDKRRQKKIYGSSTQMSVIPLADALCEKGIYSHASKISWVNFGGLWVSDSHTIRPSHAWAYPYTHSTYCACITSGHPSSLATTTLSLESAARLALPRSRSTLRAAPRRCGPSLRCADRSSWKEEASTSAVTVWGEKSRVYDVGSLSLLLLFGKMSHHVVSRVGLGGHVGEGEGRRGGGRRSRRGDLVEIDGDSVLQRNNMHMFESDKCTKFKFSTRSRPSLPVKKCW